MIFLQGRVIPGLPFYKQKWHDFQKKDQNEKIKFSIKDFFIKFDQTRWSQRVWSNLLKKSLMEDFTFCTGTVNPIMHNVEQWPPTCEVAILYIGECYLEFKTFISLWVVSFIISYLVIFLCLHKKLQNFPKQERRLN